MTAAFNAGASNASNHDPQVRTEPAVPEATTTPAPVPVATTTPQPPLALVVDNRPVGSGSRANDSARQVSGSKTRFPDDPADLLIDQMLVSPAGLNKLLWVPKTDIVQLHQIDTAVGGGSYGTLIGAVDGINRVFVVSRGNYVAGTISLFYAGQRLDQDPDGNGFVETNPVTGTITMDYPPKTNKSLLADYDYV